jgi:hypothetical protein
MDTLEHDVHWAEREGQEGKRNGYGQLGRIWPVVTISFVPFGALAFFKLDPLLAAACTGAVALVAVLVADDILVSIREAQHGRTRP